MTLVGIEVVHIGMLYKERLSREKRSYLWPGYSKSSYRAAALVYPE